MIGLLVAGAGILISIVIGWFVFTRDPKRTLNRLYGILSLSFALLIFFNYLTTNPADRSLFFVRMVIFSTTVAGMTLLLLILEMREKLANKTTKQMAFLLVSSTAVVCFLEFSPAVFSSISLPPESIPQIGWAFPLFVIHFGLILITSITYLFLGSKNARTVSERQQYRLIQIGVLPILLLAPITSVLLPVILSNTSLIQYSPLYIVFFLSMVGYAIIRHGLFDLKAAAMRTAAYSLSLMTLAIIYFVTAYLMSITIFKNNVTTGISTSPINMVLALLLAFIFQPIKDFFDKATDKIFFRDRYSTEEFYARLSQKITHSLDLRDLLQQTAQEIGTTLKAEQAFFYIKYNGVHHVSAGTKNRGKFSSNDIEFLAEKLPPLTMVIALDEASQTIDKGIKDILSHNKVSILMQLARDSVVFGYLALGDQRSSRYTSRDIKVLETISDELVIAIQNALSIQEVRDLNANLQARINEATKELVESNRKLKKLDETKDEFISMASHQLRTPLTSVKGYLSMVLEGDAGAISKEQRALLDQAFESSQRMVYLIGDFLNISRLRTGKFVLEKALIDLSFVVKEEIAQLRDTAERRGISFNYERPSQLPFVMADENKLRQVMMNFMDNAVFYNAPNGKITVELYKSHEGIVFKVKDSGIGVPKSEQPKLFTKFFRAPNARRQRPDGTGIGLYMAKKVIVAHGGSIIFESKENVGSTFGFILPYASEEKTNSHAIDA